MRVGRGSANGGVRCAQSGTKYRPRDNLLPHLRHAVVLSNFMPRFLRSHRPDDRMPRDERGWRVAPAPDGRGMPDPPARRPPHRSRWFLWLVGLLLVFNFGSVLLVQPGAQTRVKVPFSPYFVSAV